MKGRRKLTGMRRRFVAQQREREAENRRRLLAKLDPETANLARREFAKLGLSQ